MNNDVRRLWGSYVIAGVRPIPWTVLTLLTNANCRLRARSRAAQWSVGPGKYSTALLPRRDAVCECGGMRETERKEEKRRQAKEEKCQNANGTMEMEMKEPSA